jgi:2-polyprenyl-3-methyl-5-hydroxy-6-metoxy-1,4-benzoquinol methylase
VEFDQFSENYTQVNDKALAIFGEGTNYFAQYKMAFLARHFPPDLTGTFLDYGCGIGIMTRLLRDYFQKARITGFDISRKSIEIAKQNSLNSDIQFIDRTEQFSEQYDIILLTNVLHHIQLPDRQAFIQEVEKLVSPMGSIIIFEHNTLNPVAMAVLKRHPFDQDAIFVSYKEAEALLQSIGFSSRVQFICFFPAFLKWLRFLEPRLSWLPLGAQYACIAHRSESMEKLGD